MASLKKIAQDVGVSHALVSRVLSNRMGTTRVSAVTREAILRKAKELQYEPNPTAVALKRGIKGVVGLFLHEVGVEGSELSLNFIQSAGNALTERGMNLWLKFFIEDAEFRAACNETLTKKIDGLIVAGIPHPKLIANLLKSEKRGLHVVSACHGMKEDSGLTNFQVDHEQQSFVATKHLLDMGCTRIAYFDLPPERLRGYLRAHGAANTEPRPELRFHAPNYTATAGYNCMKALLESRIAYDGIVTQSDSHAVGALRCMGEAGLPRKLWPKITGIDDSPIARLYADYPITSVTSEMAECAKLAVAALEAKMKGELVESKLVQPRLIVRASTGG